MATQLLLFGIAIVLLTMRQASSLSNSKWPSIKPDAYPQYLNQVKQMFDHAYDGYVRYAFPFDELAPLTCTGRPSLGNYSLTLVDSLSTLAIMDDHDRFQQALDLIEQSVDFDADETVSLFETNIRMVGGLLSGHFFAQKFGQRIRYDGNSLLRLAVDLADRLLPAFNTSTGIPFGSVNLRHGVPEGETTVVCTACAGSLSMEFGWISLLTGNPIYKQVAKRAVMEVWAARNPVTGLLGSHIDLKTRHWRHRESGIGGGIDSFYEYLVKSWLLFGDEDYARVFEDAYDYVLKYVKLKSSLPFYAELNVDGAIGTGWLASLSAYWPGLQVLVGDVFEAVEQIELYALMLTKMPFLPEQFDTHNRAFATNHMAYPLRPEFVESLWYVYLATRDSHLVDLAAELLDRLEQISKTKCGYADIDNIQTLARRDSMQSFILSETFKYFYLIFLDAAHSKRHLVSPSNQSALPPNFNHERWVFTTEAHPLPITVESVTAFQRDKQQGSTTTRHNYAATSFITSASNNHDRTPKYPGNHELAWEACRRRKDWSERCVSTTVVESASYVQDKSKWPWFERNRLDLASTGKCYRSQWTQAIDYPMWKTY